MLTGSGAGGPWWPLSALARRTVARAWVVGSFASLASYGAYAISIWAMTVAPIAVVAALRETSILFAVLIGWLVFGERMTRDKAVAAALIVAGVLRGAQAQAAPAATPQTGLARSPSAA